MMRKARMWFALGVMALLAGCAANTERDNALKLSTCAQSLRAMVGQTARKGSGKYRIGVYVWCDSPFGCQQNIRQAAVNFNKAVNAAGG